MSDQDTVIAFLGRPETHGAVGPVAVAETHISFVFLAGDRAFKLKKAVRTPYLDYSTPEKRRAACEAELRINRAMSPGLYLGVAPVTEEPDGSLHLGGPGDPVDWVVVMRRFPDDAQLDHVAERGELGIELAVALADRIAAVHDAAEVRRDHGGAKAFKRLLDGVIEGLREHSGALLPEGEVADWSGQASAAAGRLGALLDRRRDAGHVRACHGDLHLQNICLVDGAPVLFDAIEFDPAISNIDVMYDLAFLLMDLERRALRPLGNRIFNRYLDRRDETDALPALPLFLSLRAAIRAMVRATAAHQHGDAAATAEEARRYLALAGRLIAPPPPRLVAIGGLSGSGKSTVSYALAPTLGAVPGARVLRTDMLRKRAAGIPPETPMPPTAYTPEAQAATYRMVLDEARTCLAAGHAVIADAVHGRSEGRTALAAAAAEAGAPFIGLWLDLDVDTLAARLAGRTGDASDATVEVMRRQAATIEPPADWVRIDASGDIEAVVARAAGVLTASR